MEKLNYHKELIERLRDGEYAVGYLKAALELMSSSGDRQLFELAVNNIAQAWGVIEEEEHRTCPECDKVFLPVKRQEYCGMACSQKARTRRFRASHSKVA